MGHGCQDLIQILSVCIRNEYLSKLIAIHQMNDLSHPIGIQLVEDVVQQENGSGQAPTLQEGKLGQLQSDQIALILPLLTDPSDQSSL